MNNVFIDANLFSSWDENLAKTIQDYYENLRNVKSTVTVLQSVGPWADHYVSELAPIVQGPLTYFFTNFDTLESLESLNVVVEQIENKILALGSFGSWAEKLIDCLLRVQSFIEDRIKVILTVFRIPLFPQEVFARETDFFEYHGFGRPPRTLGRALKAGLSQVMGRMRSSPALA